MDMHESHQPIRIDALLRDTTVHENEQAGYPQRKMQPAAIPVTPELSMNHLPVLVQPRDHDQHFFTFPQWLYEKLETLARGEGMTMDVILLTAFQALLYRYSYQDDLVVGTCRVENMIEDSANILTVHIDMSDNPAFRELARRVRAVVEEPEARLQQQQRPISFQNIFAFASSLLEHLEPEDLDEILLEENNWRRTCELAFIVQETEQGLHGWIEYQPRYFEQEAIMRLVGHLEVVLEGAAADPALRLSELPLLTASERKQIVVDWNDTEADYALDQCIHQMFEDQVELSPDAPAVIFQNTSLTYRELNRRANQLAHYLQRSGVGPEVLVGISVERSLEMIVGVLGILKAGGAYVPLDPAYPSERIAFMLSDSQVTLLLTQERLHVNLPEHGVKVVYLDKDWEKISLEREDNPETSMRAENAAYVIYTSGSTGTPKGVVIQHNSLVNYAQFSGEAYELKTGDRVLQFAPLSFDASAEEIYPCLVKGATLVLRTSSMIDSISMFLQRCQEWGITVLDLPTAYWHELSRKIDSGTTILPSSLRLVIIGGEKALPELLSSWQRHAGPRVQLINTYGPTEATIVTTMYRVPESLETGEALREVPIGSPIANVQAYILDRYLNPVPIGVPGELHIGGVSLARGYLNRPTLTAQKFIANVFSPRAEARLYKTGDRARYLPTGDLEFLGRFDEQVKIRGYRVELGEVESVLGQHPEVQEAVVVAREEGSGDKRLAAYVVPCSGRSLTGSTLRLFMLERLPDYMVPAAFVLLEALPLSPSGKVDRHGLPEPEQERNRESESYVAPVSADQRRLVQIWEELLNVRPIGIRDNFFELGGHSLLAVRLIDEIEQVWGKRISAATLLDGATIEELVNALEQSEIASSGVQTRTTQSQGLKRSSAQSDLPRFSLKSALARFTRKRQN